jgi:hypothetical protein
MTAGWRLVNAFAEMTAEGMFWIPDQVRNDGGGMFWIPDQVRNDSGRASG